MENNTNQRTIEHWFMRIGDGENFNNSSSFKLWGCKKRTSKTFLNEIKKGDIIWFVPNQDTSGVKGKIYYCAIYENHIERVLGPLIALTETNEELGWREVPNWNSDWNIQIYYSKLFKIESLNLQINIHGRQTSKGKINDDMCINFNIGNEWNNINKYCKIQVN